MNFGKQDFDLASGELGGLQDTSYRASSDQKGGFAARRSDKAQVFASPAVGSCLLDDPRGLIMGPVVSHNRGEDPVGFVFAVVVVRIHKLVDICLLSQRC